MYTADDAPRAIPTPVLKWPFFVMPWILAYFFEMQPHTLNTIYRSLHITAIIYAFSLSIPLTRCVFLVTLNYLMAYSLISRAFPLEETVVIVCLICSRSAKCLSSKYTLAFTLFCSSNTESKDEYSGRVIT